MARGGARNRSGPQKDEESLRSENAGVVLTAQQPYEGDAPEFPLPAATDRELEVWRQAWTTPQASAWALQSWRWRTVAMWVRWSVRMEAEDASAALGNVVVRFADQIGLTPAGLKENGWKIADAAAESKPALATVTEMPQRTSARDRFRAAPDGGA